MAQQNRFLQEFINMRKKLNEAPSIPTLHQSSQVKSNAAGTTSLVSNKPQRQTKSDEPIMDDTITYKRIIDDKPPKADVIEYLRGRIENIVAMAD